MVEKVKAQVAVWVIIAIVLVASILFFFLILRGVKLPSSDNSGAGFDVESYLRECSSSFVNQVADKMLPQGGFVNPMNYAMFDDTKIEYICKNAGFYKPCVHQHPMLVSEMENEIKKTILNDVDKCFVKMKDDLQSSGSQVSIDRNMALNVDLEQDKIVLNVKRKINIENRGQTRRGENYEIEIPSPTYNLAKIAAEIADQEARYCYFEFVGFNIIYPRYQIKLFQMSQPIKIYTIKDLKSGKEMKIAIRSCAIPAGI